MNGFRPTLPTRKYRSDSSERKQMRVRRRRSVAITWSRMRSSELCFIVSLPAVNFARRSSTAARSSGVPASASYSQTCRPGLSLREVSHGLFPVATLSFHIVAVCSYSFWQCRLLLFIWRWLHVILMLARLVGRTKWIDTWSISFHRGEGIAEAGSDTFNCAFVVSDTWQASQRFGDETSYARERMSGICDCGCKLLQIIVDPTTPSES